MSKSDLQFEMSSALRAASLHSMELDALLIESEYSAELTSELGIRICEAEKAWLSEMERYQVAFKRYQEVNGKSYYIISA